MTNGVEPLPLGGERGRHDLGLDEVLGGVVVDVSGRLGEVADLDLGGRPAVPDANDAVISSSYADVPNGLRKQIRDTSRPSWTVVPALGPGRA